MTTPDNLQRLAEARITDAIQLIDMLVHIKRQFKGLELEISGLLDVRNLLTGAETVATLEAAAAVRIAERERYWQSTWYRRLCRRILDRLSPAHS